MTDREKRYCDGLELRSSAGNVAGPGTIVGYAAKFDRPSEVLRDKRTGRAFVEVIKRGAFRESLGSADVRAMFDHDTGKILGRNKAGTLRIDEDHVGLRVEIDLPDTTAGRDTAVSIGRGDVSGMSFGFAVKPAGDSWDHSGDMPLRSLHNVTVDDVTVTAFPAYLDTEVALRSLERSEAERRDATAVAEPPPATVTAPDPEPPPDPAAILAELVAERDRLQAEIDALAPPPAEPGPEPEPAAEAAPDPEAVRRETERDRDRLKLLGVA